ncbi:beta-N-acetylhexosaminidase [Leeia sp.]|uniref:beta-N-acetylhexosaminidase n=1 Tax=Leeia sp. TaxID=2884678 RepID=UPI0035B04575
MTTVNLPLGPVCVDLAGTELTDAERQRLLHPQVGGVILFSRNFRSVAQLCALTREIHQLRSPRLIIAVDHEGGRVQRFRDGFTRLPPMAELGKLWNDDRAAARALAARTGWVLAAELRASGVDFSFAPVLDLDYGVSTVIGNRAFHAHPHAVSELGQYLMQGMRQAGMNACGKHFPGHGHVVLDSHHALPVDDRPLSEIHGADLQPFRRLIEQGLAAVMPAHVIYAKVDERPAGFSPRWLQDILRGQLGFQGAIISDALDMAGAAFAGNTIEERAKAAFEAGCDLVLATNRPEEAERLLQRLDWQISPVSLSRLARLHGEPNPLQWDDLVHDLDFQSARREVAALAGEGDISRWGPDVGEA